MYARSGVQLNNKPWFYARVKSVWRVIVAHRNGSPGWQFKGGEKTYFFLRTSLKLPEGVGWAVWLSSAWTCIKKKKKKNIYSDLLCFGWVGRWCWGVLDNCFDPWPQSHTVMTAARTRCYRSRRTKGAGSFEKRLVKRGLMGDDRESKQGPPGVSVSL